MFGALKRGFRSMASHILVRNVVGELQPKRTLAASRGFLAAARLACFRNTGMSCWSKGHTDTFQAFVLFQGLPVVIVCAVERLSFPAVTILISQSSSAG